MFLSASYGLDFTNAESPEYKKAEIIFQRCIAKHWSYKEFQERLYDFIDNNKWINFTPASFLSDYERPSLYGEAWKNAEKGKNMNAIADMECYEIPDENGQIVKLYRYSDPEHPVKNHIDKWAKINTMKAFAAPMDSQPEEIKPFPGTVNPDAPIDCEKFLTGFAQNLFKSGDYDRLSDEGRKFVDEFLAFKKSTTHG